VFTDGRRWPTLFATGANMRERAPSATRSLTSPFCGASTRRRAPHDVAQLRQPGFWFMGNLQRAAIGARLQIKAPWGIRLFLAVAIHHAIHTMKKLGAPSFLFAGGMIQLNPRGQIITTEKVMIPRSITRCICRRPPTVAVALPSTRVKARVERTRPERAYGLPPD
jgi:hypothetical protein